MSLLNGLDTENLELQLEAESDKEPAPSLSGPGLKAVPGGDNYRYFFLMWALFQ